MHNINFFKEELDLIEDSDLRAMTEVALSEAPAWFWVESASLTQKHHPPDDLVEGGLCVHEKKVAWLAHRFFTAFNEDSDVGVSAALTHDIRHRGSGDEVGSVDDYKRHAEAAADYLWGVGQEQFSYGARCQEKWARVIACVSSHMGKFGESGKPPLMLDQQLLHLADVAASFRLLVGLPFYTDDIPPLPDVMEAGKHFVERDGKTLFNFGKKHYRQDVMEVMTINPGYFDWMLKAGFPDDVIEQVKQIQKEYCEERKKRLQVESGNLPLG